MKDMSLERNTLMEEIYPKIKEYCKERHGLEFQGIFNYSSCNIIHAENYRQFSDKKVEINKRITFKL
jgi:hypothetical protein